MLRAACLSLGSLLFAVESTSTPALEPMDSTGLDSTLGDECLEGSKSPGEEECALSAIQRLSAKLAVQDSLPDSVTSARPRPECGGKAGPQKVIFIQDACLDDFLSLAALARAHKAGEIELLGDIVVNGDSTLPDSMEVNYKFHQALGIGDIPLLLSRARLFNQFPWLYRGDTYTLAKTPGIESMKFDIPWKEYEDYPDADAWLVKTLQDACPSSITILHVAALTNLQVAFKKDPSLPQKVKELVWMAGSINVPGNTDGTGKHGPGHGYPGMNGFAEWNVYADPFAAKYVMETTTFPIHLIPLDLCDKLPLCNDDSCEFMNSLKAEESTNCAYPEIQTALKQAFTKSIAASPFLRLWDSAATAYVLKPHLFLDQGTTQLAVVTAWANFGRLVQPKDAGVGEQRFRTVSASFNLTKPSAYSELYSFLSSAPCER